MKGLYILAPNRWRRDVSKLRHLASFHVPVRITQTCGVKDGQNRRVKISPQGSSSFTAHCRVSSGCEILVRKEYRAHLTGCTFVEFELLDWKPRELTKATNLVPDVDEDFHEGGSVLRSHLTKERNRSLVQSAKDIRLSETGNLTCDVCGFSFKEKYGDIGDGFIEAHHLVPIAEVNKRTKVAVKDLALLCSNCHRMIHRGEPLLTIGELRSLIGAA
jgi:hypothetical protein